MRVAAHKLLVNAAQHGMHLKLTVINCNLRMQHHLQQQVAQFLPQCVRIRSVQSRQHLIGFLEQSYPQRLVRLLAIPGTARGRAQVRNRHLERGKTGAGRQRRHKQTCQMANFHAVINSMQRPPLNQRRGSTCCVDQRHEMLLRILVHQREL